MGAFALLGLIISSLIGIYHQGFAWLQTFMPAGIPRILAPIVIPIEVISFLAKPFSLTVRLVMNMIVGHILLDIMAYFTTISGLAGVFPLIFVLLMTVFELGIAFCVSVLVAIRVFPNGLKSIIPSVYKSTNGAESLLGAIIVPFELFVVFHSPSIKLFGKSAVE